jgi:fatty-acyl-CoA synthase
VQLYWACQWLGATFVPLSPRVSAADIAYCREDSEAKLFLEADVEVEALVGDAHPGALAADDDHESLMLYTSGTTGRPKGVPRSHRADRAGGLSQVVHQAYRYGGRTLGCMPLYHTMGIHSLVAMHLIGGCYVCQPDWDAGAALELIERERITSLMGVPANYLFMSQEPRFADADLSSLRLAVVGGAPMPLALLEVWAGRGVEIVQGYGLTEAAPNVLCLPPEDARRKAGSAGKPYPYVACDLSPDGELLVRGPNVFPGYWRNEEATASAFHDGWLLTGDTAERDDEGSYRIRGRLKDMVVSGGENVYPAEIEAVLHEHPAVADAAVIGVADEKWGEVCAAFVVAESPVSVEELREHCLGQLARFKVPKWFWFIDELPRNSMGKIQKSELHRRRLDGVGPGAEVPAPPAPGAGEMMA